MLVAAYAALVAFQVRSHPREDYDEYIFMDVGRQIARIGLPLRTYDLPVPGFFFDHTPLYVYWVGLVTRFGGPTLTLVRASTLLCGVGTVVAVYLLVATARGRVSGFVGGAVLATNPFFAFYSWFVRMEVPLAFFLVLAVVALWRDRALLAGLLIATAVLLKEIALAFWLVAVAWLLLRRRVRAAFTVGIPALVGLGAWFAYAASLEPARLEFAFSRWLGSAVGGDTDPRLRVRALAWAETIVQRIAGPILVFAAGATAALVRFDRSGIPAITAVPIAYVLVTVASSFVIQLKEPRYLIAIVPMLAIAIGLLVDWDAAWARIRRPPEPAPG